MENYTFLVTFLLSIIISGTQTTIAAATTTTSSSSTQKYNTYIQTACNSTTYPQVCDSSLSPYASTIKANPQKLCNTALSVALNAAKNTSSAVLKISKQTGLTRTDAAIIKDCIDNIKDSIDELQQSLNAMGHLSDSSSVEFQIDNIKTWVSAAITDENTCTDGFDGEKVSAAVKSKIRNSIVTVVRQTSNALSLINSLKY